MNSFRAGNRLRIVASNFFRRFYHAEIAGSDVRLFEDAGKNVELLRIPHVWLRDHCRCPACYNAKTFQRSIEILDLPLDVKPQRISIENQALKISWPNGHVTEFAVEWLRNNLKPKFPRFGTKKLWNGTLLNSAGAKASLTVPFNEFQTDAGLKKLYANFLTYGVAFVGDAPVSYEASQEAFSRFAMPEDTVYGRFWKFSAESLDHADTAYTNIALGPHTDSTYYTYTPGVQVFHILEHTGGTGGSTILVDGFNSINQLREQNPTAFALLTKLQIPHEFLDKGVSIQSEEPVIKLDPRTNEIVQLRYNPYDRAPLNNLDPETMVKFYKAYTELAKRIMDPANALWLKLEPGQIAFIDNWRVMHGRSAFTGRRVMCGCYLSRDDWLSRARVAGVL